MYHRQQKNFLRYLDQSEASRNWFHKVCYLSGKGYFAAVVTSLMTIFC